MDKFLLSSETVLPISSEPISDTSLLIVDGVIRKIGDTGKLKRDHPSTHTIDLGKGILLPGLINAHAHLELGWIKKKISSFHGFAGWLRQIVNGKMEGVSEYDIEQSVREGLKALKSSGVTTVGEISSYKGLDKPILKDSGLRTVLFREVVDSNEEETDFYNFENEETFEERLFPHAPYSCSPELLKKVLNSQKQNLTPLGIHLGESPDEVEFVRGGENAIERDIFPLIGKAPFNRPVAQTPYSYLKKLGFFPGNKISTVHMVQVPKGEVNELKADDVGIILCPRSNMFVQVGAPPLKEYAGLKRVGLGTDGLSSNYNLNFFAEIRFLHLLYSDAIGRDAGFKTVYAATLGGAKSLYLEDKIGSIEEGKEADLIFLNLTNQSDDPYLSVISATEQNLEMLMVRGKVLYSKKDFSLNS